MGKIMPRIKRMTSNLTYRISAIPVKIAMKKFANIAHKENARKLIEEKITRLDESYKIIKNAGVIAPFKMASYKSALNNVGAILWNLLLEKVSKHEAAAQNSSALTEGRRIVGKPSEEITRKTGECYDAIVKRIFLETEKQYSMHAKTNLINRLYIEEVRKLMDELGL
ncbi:MAG: hypothetical protein V1494_04660 [Candidatus Diapherotrites archaeon]